MNIQATTELAVSNAPRSEPIIPKVPVVESGERPPQPQLVSVVAAAGEPHDEPDKTEVKQVLDGINTFLRSGENHIQFSIHEKAQRLMVQVIDNETQEVIRTFPPKELLDLAARIGEMVGTLIDETG